MHVTLKYSFFILFLFSLFVSLSAVDDIITCNLKLSQKSPLNNLIHCYVKGNRGKKILLIGSIHGNEKAGINLSLKVMNDIFSKTDMRNTLICIPTVNPDGNSLDRRTNSHNIDINRNFPATNWAYADSAKLEKQRKIFWGGTKPASETETKFILKIDSTYKPDAIIIIHQFMDCVQYDGSGYWLAANIAYRTKQKLLDNIGYATYGSIGSYFGKDKNREVVTIEIPKDPSYWLQQNIVNALDDIVEKGY